ncbi:MAG TPA: acyl carrier protein [Acidimicrobiia bacterium]|jgi:acyl carrier protein|nr:acyl carrier protein [Acidimicrobiia bacterium]
MSDRLIEVFAQVLNVESSALSDDTSPDNTELWDSLAAMDLVTSIEDTFDIPLTTREIMRMRSIGAAREVLLAKGVEGI